MVVGDVVHPDGVVLRESASLDSAIVARCVPRGTQVDVIRRRGLRLLVATRTTEGWASAVSRDGDVLIEGDFSSVGDDPGEGRRAAPVEPRAEGMSALAHFGGVAGGGGVHRCGTMAGGRGGGRRLVSGVGARARAAGAAAGAGRASVRGGGGGVRPRRVPRGVDAKKSDWECVYFPPLRSVGWSGALCAAGAAAHCRRSIHPFRPTQ